MKDRLAALIDGDAAHLIGIGEDIFAHPELAWQEHRTADLVAGQLRALGLPVTEGLAGTGVRAELVGAGSGPTVCVLAELDAIRVPGHPAADPATGAAHACGHNAQVAHLVGVARAFVAADLAGKLNGRVVFFAVPAEEYLDIRFTVDDRSRFPGGKQELIRLGHFDDIDAAMMVHAVGDTRATPLGMTWQHTGFTPLRAEFAGYSAHAASAAGDGVDAMAAARVALHALDAQREAFADHVRVHPVLRTGDPALNVIADHATVDTLIRGLTPNAISQARTRVERSMRAGALALGAGLTVTVGPGYRPLTVDRGLGEVFRRQAIALTGAANWTETPVTTASTDAGDLSALIPVLHPTHGGCVGANHSAQFRVTDPYVAYVLPAKALAWTIVELLAPGAPPLHHGARLTREAYVAEMLTAQGDRSFSGDPVTGQG
ncbi:amidohydrolase [Micromonospora craniellae]|uniref:Amidohydrolase n=1 Tax=Micromonospora craniellae TaxID=2294034 RepID=A0A372G663_9ACTN|nr:amidohydrolase [Micromonospora craniellae]QOC90130.1 amidohydrolase [Micromonospora craniellae]RFS48483.1 amidohydrolase [Micromonospora craniellae]